MPALPVLWECLDCDVESADPSKKYNYTAHQRATQKATGVGHRVAEVPQVPTNDRVLPHDSQDSLNFLIDHPQLVEACVNTASARQAVEKYFSEVYRREEYVPLRSVAVSSQSIQELGVASVSSTTALQHDFGRLALGTFTFLGEALSQAR